MMMMMMTPADMFVRVSVFAVCLLLSVPVFASLNDTGVGDFDDQSRSLSDPLDTFLFRGDWDYGPDHGPEHWPGFCNTGQKQSPVDLVEGSATSSYVEALAFFNYHVAAPLKLVNNGHSVSAQITEKCPRGVAAGKLPGLYYLDSFHFHWKSEHTIGGKQYPLEMHLVHVHEKYKSVKEAMGDSAGLAVIGVMFEESGTDNTALTPLLEGVKKAAPAVDSSADVGDFVLRSILPNSDVFFRYEGSLTTPDCNEVVQWTVLQNTLQISSSQLQVFYEVQDSHKAPLKKNFRPVMPLNSRTLYLYRSATSRALVTWSLLVLPLPLSLHVY